MADHADIDHTGLTGVGGGTPDAHAASHENGGSDEIDVTGLTGAGGSGGLVDFARAKRTAGDVAYNSTSFGNVDTGTDLVLSASTGDVVEARIACNTDTPSTWCVMDVVTVVSGSPVNSFVADGAAPPAGSMPGWGNSNLAALPYLGGSKRYTLVAGDISGGTVTLRLRVKSGGAVTLRASADPFLYFEATNLGAQL